MQCANNDEQNAQTNNRYNKRTKLRTTNNQRESRGATIDNKAAPFKGTLPAWQHPTTAAPASSNVLVGWVQPALPNNAPSFWPRNKIHMLRSAA